MQKSGNANNYTSPALPTEKWRDQKKADTSSCTHPKPARCSASTTSTPPPPTCHTWGSLHSLDSSTIFQPPSHHTSGQKSQSNNNWWSLKRVFQPFCSATVSEIADFLEMNVLCKACAEWENGSTGLLVFEQPYYNWGPAHSLEAYIPWQSFSNFCEYRADF